ncbi:hypothetical protein [Legionella spiritensis]|uniref:hypothetical protein n=1 Tax=Legionella spiritensis TaxID=452 RepID=UPI000F6FFEE6|nr:hypothetical protein [Legionella spiritensis]VEG92299.1 Uncharacterised protein [Legionella spiritensis]
MSKSDYFATVGKLKEEFTIIKYDFEKTVDKSIKQHQENQESIKKFPNKLDDNNLKQIQKTTDRFEKHISALKEIEVKLTNLRDEINQRSKFFKTGNIKEKIDNILTKEEVVALRKEIKTCVKALEKAERRKEYDPVIDYLSQYKDQHASVKPDL